MQEIYFIGSKKVEEYPTCSPEEVLEYLKKLDFVAFDTETTGWHPITDKLLCYQMGDRKKAFVIEEAFLPISFFKELLETRPLIIQNAQFDLKFLFHEGIYPHEVWDTFLAQCVLLTGYKDRLKQETGLGYLGQHYCGVTLDKGIRGAIHKLGLSREVIKYAAEDVLYLHEIKEKQEVLIAEQELQETIKLENEAVFPLAFIGYKGMKLDVDGWLKQAKVKEKELLEIETKLDEFIVKVNKAYYSPTITYNKINAKTGKASKARKPFSFDLFNPDEGPKKVTGINWQAQGQVGKILEKEFGVTLLDKEGKESTNSKLIEIRVKELQKEEKEFPSENLKAKITFLKLIIDHRELAKAVSTYGESFVKDYIYPDNYIRTTFWQVLNTGRVSAGSNKKSQRSPNTQNVPVDDDDSKNYRKFFIAPDGYDFVTIDFNSQEPRITADKCQDPNLLEFILHGDGDLHAFVASKMYSHILAREVVITKANPFVEVNGEKINGRQTAKAVNLGLDYGKTAYTVKYDLMCDDKTAQKFIDMVKGVFPRKEKYFDHKRKQTFRQGYILINNVTKRKSYVDNFERLKELEEANAFGMLGTKKARSEFYKWKGKIERDSQNYPIQGSAADMTKKALVLCFNKIKEKYLNCFIYGIKQQEFKGEGVIVNVVHDEIDFNSEEHITEEFTKDMVECMEYAASIFCQSVPIPAEPVIKKYWSK